MWDSGCFPAGPKRRDCGAICWWSEDLQGEEEQLLVHASDAGGQTEDQDGFTHPDGGEMQEIQDPSFYLCLK